MPGEGHDTASFVVQGGSLAHKIERTAVQIGGTAGLYSSEVKSQYCRMASADILDIGFVQTAEQVFSWILFSFGRSFPAMSVHKGILVTVHNHILAGGCPEGFLQAFCRRGGRAAAAGNEHCGGEDGYQYFWCFHWVVGFVLFIRSFASLRMTE